MIPLSDAQTAYRQKVFNGLVESLKQHGAGQVEVEVDGELIVLEKLTKPVANCEVWLLTDEPVFSAGFDFGTSSLTDVTFTTSDRDARIASSAVPWKFSSTDQAAQRLILTLTSGRVSHTS